MTDRRRHVHPASPGLPDCSRLSSRPRVVVVGGGIAGLAAATALAERGRRGGSGGSPGLPRRSGGRLDRTSERRRAGDESRVSRLLSPVLQLARLTAPSRSAAADAGARRRLSADRRRGPPRQFPRAAPHAAVERAGVRAAQPDVSASAIWRASMPALPHRWRRCRCPDIYHRLDHIDAETFLKSINFPESARHLAFEVFSRSFFAEPTQLSAAELATMFHIYFLGSSEGLIFDVADSEFRCCACGIRCGSTWATGVFGCTSAPKCGRSSPGATKRVSRPDRVGRTVRGGRRGVGARRGRPATGGGRVARPGR